LRNRLVSDRPGRSRITLADVANYAGVSASTASRALNGRGELSPATRAAVLEAAAALRFRPSVLARSLRTRTTFTVGFVVPDIASPFYAVCLKGAQGALEEAGYRVMLMDSEQTPEGEVAALQTLLAHQVDGLLVATTGLSTSTFAAVVDRATPCVFFDSIVPEAGAGSVTLANGDGIDQLVDHLVAHGHLRIAILAGPQSETSGSERLAAFAAATRRRGLEQDPGLVRSCRWDQDDGRRATLELLELARPPEAVVASSAELALGCLAACRERGVSLPDELALVSFDDPYFGGLLEPSLTAVGYDPGDVGRAAAALLVEAMQETGTGTRQLTIPVTLVRRRSCGCPAGVS
jgi:LacI family transcriptional regulator